LKKRRHGLGFIRFVYLDNSFNEIRVVISGRNKRGTLKKFAWRFYNASTGLGGGLNYGYVPWERRSIVHGHYYSRRHGWIHTAFHRELNPYLGLRYALYGFMKLHSIFRYKGIRKSIRKGFFTHMRLP